MDAARAPALPAQFRIARLGRGRPSEFPTSASEKKLVRRYRRVRAPALPAQPCPGGRFRRGPSRPPPTLLVGPVGERRCHRGSSAGYAGAIDLLGGGFGRGAKPPFRGS